MGDLDLFVLASAASSYGRIVGAIEAWHEEQGTDRPDRQALIQARLLVLLVVDRLSYEMIGEQIGRSKTTVGRHVADLVEVFPPLRQWLREREGPTGTLPMLERRPGRRCREKAPRDGLEGAGWIVVY